MSFRNNYNSYPVQDAQYSGQYYMQPFHSNGRVSLGNRNNSNGQQKSTEYKTKGKYSRSPVIVANSYVMVNPKSGGQPVQHKQNSHHGNHGRTQVIEIPTAESITAPMHDNRALKLRYMAGPVRPEGIKAPKNPVINLSKKKAPETYYKIAEPLLNAAHASSKSNTQLLVKLIAQRRSAYHRLQPIRLGSMNGYTVTSLDQLGDVIERYQVEKPIAKRRSLASSNYSTVFQDRVDYLLVPANANDSIDLSFDGKAINKSDFLRMMDSFSLALDEEDDNNEHYDFHSRNILPRDITSGVY
ncbi:AaceriAFR449Wp [[Ashbya] aceris (nom. inval.)]|nr:AaceriAFR449Wp [[Ashbya] aceris (nom. inval.)]